MKIIKNIYPMIALVLLAVSVFSCKYETLDEPLGEGDSWVRIDFSLPQMDVKTRAALPDEEEKRVANFFLLVVDAYSGKVTYKELYTFEPEGVEVSPNTAQSKLVKEKLMLPYGTYRFYGIANVGGTQPLFSLSEDALNAITDESQLQNLLLSLPDNKQITERTAGFLLMSGVKEQRVNSATTEVRVPLLRADAKITFSLAAAANITFTPHTYRVMRLPKKAASFAMPSTVPSTSKSDYFDSEPVHLEKINNSITFYMLENLSKAQQLIPDGEKAYKERAKQTKTPIAGAVNNPTVTNGDFVNAPINGTYLEITGDFSKNNADGSVTMARTRYFVHLGNLPDGTPGVSALNDYAIHRNTHYTYNITITDVNDLVIEAKSDRELDPRAEGDIFRSKQDFHIDAHYDAVLWKLKKTDLFNADGSLKKIHYQVKTPFSTGEDAGALDIDWVRFAPNYKASPQGWNNVNLRSYSEAATSNQLYTWPQFLEKIKDGTIKFNVSTNPQTPDLTVTIFVNENYYEKDPTQVPGAAQDMSLWKRFVNQPDRMFAVYAQRDISTDGNTTYSEPVFVVRQRSIKTFYNTTSGLQQAWGIESVTEGDQRIPYMTGIPTTPRISGAISGSDGRFNTLVELSSRYSWAFPIDYSIIGTDPNGWEKAVLMNTPPPVRMQSKYNYLRFACLSRNRDLNANGRIDPDEVRWYMPAIGQLLESWIMNDAMPYDARLFKGGYERLSFGSSTAYEVGNNSNNPMVLWAQAGSMYTAMEEAGRGNRISGDHGSSINENYFRAYYRCVRNLGIAPNPSETYPRGNVGGTPSTPTGIPGPQPFYAYDSATRTFDFSAVDKKALRSYGEKITKGELVAHDHLSPQNKLYKKMQVAKGYAKSGNTIVDYHRAFLNFGPDWYRGKSPCRTYSELPDGSDRGKWRVPNERELGVILRQTYDPGVSKPNSSIWSCTPFAFPVNQFDNPSGFFMYQMGLYYNMINIKGGPLYLGNNPFGTARVRCVRDVD